MRTVRFLGVTVIIVILAALTLGAAPPFTVTNPDVAPYVDSDYHVIPANTTFWYRLNYAGDHSQMTIQLDDGSKNLLQFMVHKPEQMIKWWENPSPVGKGTPHQDDLAWSGNSHEGGPWYVELTNPTDKQVVFRFETQGKGILPEKPATAPAPAIAPAAVTQPTFENTDPTKAIPISDKQYVIPANTTLWYSFQYPGDGSQVVVRLERGVDEKLSYMVHTPSQLSKWWDVNPVGRGSPQENALVWSSRSSEGGTYLVEVTNNNPHAVAFNLLVE